MDISLRPNLDISRVNQLRIFTLNQELVLGINVYYHNTMIFNTLTLCIPR